MPAWKKAGHTIISTPAYIKDTLDKGLPTVLIDLRSVNEARAAHIPGAVSIPAKEISQAKDKFPAEKTAPIILYANDTQTATDKFRTVRGWGYTNTTVLENGIESWKKAGGLVITGDITTKVSYVPKLGPGEISTDEFRRIAETRPADKLILDVRDADETEDGTLAGSKNIPVKDITARLAEIPREKEIITHCATGVRAEMAFLTLKEAGYKVRFLNAKIEIENGKYTITRE